MSKYSHPGDGALLCYLDGELPGRQAREIERHIEACWQCRTELEELQKTVGECVEYRKEVLAEHLPAAPNRWCDLYTEMERLDAAGQSLWARIVSMLPGGRGAVPGGWRWASAAAAVALLAMALYQWRETPSVKAATMLKRAVAAADVRPPAVRRIKLRTKNLEVTRSIGRREAVADRTAAPLEAMFQAARYEWADPLSARAFQAWRDGVPRKTDEFRSTADGYQIRTTAAEGELSAATLTLRAADLAPVEERLEFRNREWVELTELTEPGMRGDNVAAVEAPMRPAEPSRPAAVAPGPSASISDELQVLAALHQIGADLGDPVDVRLSEGRVLVSGVGIPAPRQQQIHSALVGMSKVAVQFADPSVTPAPAESQAPATAGTASAPPGKVQARIEQQLGGRAEFERFSGQMLDATEAAMSRIYALRQLAQRFPAESESGLSAKDRSTLREMARAHAAALTGQVAALQHAIGPVLANIGARPRAAEAGSTNWQAGAEELYRGGHRFEIQLSSALGVAAAAGGQDDQASDLAVSLAALRAQADRCRELLARE